MTTFKKSGGRCAVSAVVSAPSFRLQGRGRSPSGPKIQAQRAGKPKSTIWRLLAPFIFLPAPLRYGWLPAYTFDFPAAYALSRGCSYFILHPSYFLLRFPPVVVFAKTLGSECVEMILHLPIQNQPHSLRVTSYLPQRLRRNPPFKIQNP